MRKYYKRIQDDKEYISYSSISNGVILTKFSKENGHPISNGCYQVFIELEDLALNYREFEFKVEINKAEVHKKEFGSFFSKIVEILDDFGIFQDGDEFHTIESECGLIQDALFMEWNNRAEYDEHVQHTIGNQFPEDRADDLKFSNATDLYSTIYEMRNAVGKLANKLGE